MKGNKEINNIIINSEDGSPKNTHISLADGTELGTVQAITWTISVGQLATCDISTILTTAQLKALQSQTQVKFNLDDESLKLLLHECYTLISPLNTAQSNELKETLKTIIA